MHAEDRSDRRRFGRYYTPAPTALGLAQVLIGRGGPRARVVDPACGDGAFLLAAADVLHRIGAPVDRIVTDQLYGMDVDPEAVRVARDRLGAWAAEITGRRVEAPDDHLVVADGLDAAKSPDWVGTMDVAIGNPPFGSQLRSLTVRPSDRQRELRRQFGVGALGYADSAGLFLLRSLDLVRPGGLVSLILPTSFLAARDARPLRAAVSRRAEVEAVWTGGDDIGFDASVSVWAPVLRTQAASTNRGEVVRFGGRTVEESDRISFVPDPESWSPLMIDGACDLGAQLAAGTGAVLGDVARSRAGFRRHLYGLAPFVFDDPKGRRGDLPRLVTTGAIDPFRLRRDVPVRFDGRRFDRPVVDTAALRTADPTLATWVDDLLRPKVVVASQGTVVEAVVDVDGAFVPSTPVIALLPTVGVRIGVDHLAAVVGSPVASMLLHRRAGGSGMGRGTCRVTGAFLESLPLPSDPIRWNSAARSVRRAQVAAGEGDRAQWHRALDRYTSEIIGSYQIGDVAETVAWWRDRRPEFRDARRLTG